MTEAPKMASITERHPLGWTDLRVSPVALGTMQFGWLLSDVESFAILDAYHAAGGNLIETADMYGGDQNLGAYEPNRAHCGVTEEIIGRWMADRGVRDEMLVATKVRARVWDGDDGEGLSRKHVHRACDDALHRLRVDHIDLYQAHWPDETPLPEVLAAFGELITAGKIRYFGTSNFWAFGNVLEPLIAASKESDDLPRVASEQPRFSLVNRGEYEGGLSKLVEREDLGVICFSPLAGGFLTGKYRHGGETPPSVRARFVGQYLNERGYALTNTLADVAGAHSVEIPAVAVSWILHQPGVTAAIVGANSTAQLAAWAPAADLRLSTEDLSRLTEHAWAASQPEFVSW